jgi:hypothetical protein
LNSARLSITLPGFFSKRHGSSTLSPLPRVRHSPRNSEAPPSNSPTPRLDGNAKSIHHCILNFQETLLLHNTPATHFCSSVLESRNPHCQPIQRPSISLTQHNPTLHPPFRPPQPPTLPPLPAPDFASQQQSPANWLARSRRRQID